MRIRRLRDRATSSAQTKSPQPTTCAPPSPTQRRNPSTSHSPQAPVEVTNVIEAPRRHVEIERDFTGKMTGATVEDAA